MTLKEYIKSSDFSVHVYEQCNFPPFVEIEGKFYPVLEPVVQLVFSVWIIPIKVLKKTDTPGGPVFDSKIKLDEYKNYRFACPYVYLNDSSRLSLSRYLTHYREVLQDTDLDKMSCQFPVVNRLE